MNFNTKTDYGSDLFYGVDGGIMTSSRPLLRNTTLAFDRVDLSNPALTPFELYAAISGNAQVFFIKPMIPCRNLGTGVYLYYSSWMSTQTSVLPEEVHITLRLDNLVAYSAVNKMTIITTPEFSERLHDYLTMV